MFEIRGRLARVALTALLAVMVIPFVIPLITMVQGSLQGLGWNNYRTVIELPGCFHVPEVLIAGHRTLPESAGFDRRAERVLLIVFQTRRH